MAVLVGVTVTMVGRLVPSEPVKDVGVAEFVLIGLEVWATLVLPGRLVSSEVMDGDVTEFVLLLVAWTTLLLILVASEDTGVAEFVLLGPVV